MVFPGNAPAEQQLRRGGQEAGKHLSGLTAIEIVCVCSRGEVPCAPVGSIDNLLMPMLLLFLASCSPDPPSPPPPVLPLGVDFNCSQIKWDRRTKRTNPPPLGTGAPSSGSHIHPPSDSQGTRSEAQEAPSVNKLRGHGECGGGGTGIDSIKLTRHCPQHPLLCVCLWVGGNSTSSWYVIHPRP